jgi:hypothetical protein
MRAGLAGGLVTSLNPALLPPLLALGLFLGPPRVLLLYHHVGEAHATHGNRAILLNSRPIIQTSNRPVQPTAMTLWLTTGHGWPLPVNWLA